MAHSSKKFLVALCILLVGLAACGKPSHNDNQINQAQQKDPNQNQMNQ